LAEAGSLSSSTFFFFSYELSGRRLYNTNGWNTFQQQLVCKRINVNLTALFRTVAVRKSKASFSKGQQCSCDESNIWLKWAKLF
jgi:hypothetical protein